MRTVAACLALLSALLPALAQPPGPARWEKDIQQFEAEDAKNPPPAGGIDVNADNNWVNNDLTKPSVP